MQTRSVTKFKISAKLKEPFLSAALVHQQANWGTSIQHQIDALREEQAYSGKDWDGSGPAWRLDVALHDAQSLLGQLAPHEDLEFELLQRLQHQ